MVHHGFISKEVRCAIKQNIDYAKQHHTPHCLLPAKVMYPANSTKRFSWLTHLTLIVIVEECSNIISNNNDGYFYVLFLQRAYSPFMNKNSVNMKLRKLTD